MPPNLRQRRATAALRLLAVALLALSAWGVRTARLQPPALPLQTLPTLRGSYHLHTEASHDSTVSVATYAAAAKARGLDFLLVTDHDTQMHAPQVVDGVLIIPQAELNTPYGHMVGLAAPFALLPQERMQADVAQRMRALGGRGIAAHPSSYKRPWTGTLENLGGIELHNFSSAFEHYAGRRFVGVVPLALMYPFNPQAALWQLYGADTAALQRWDAAPQPDLIGICGTDAHGWIDVGRNMDVWHVVLPELIRAQPWESAHAHVVLRALASGRFYNVAGLWPGAPAFAFAASANGTYVGVPGDSMRADAVTHLTACLGAGHTQQAGTQIRMLKDGIEQARGHGRCAVVHAPAPGAWRVEVWAPLPGIAWGTHLRPVLYSNRLHLSGP